MLTVTPSLAAGEFNRTALQSGAIVLAPAPIAGTFPGDAGWWQVNGATWTVVGYDSLQMVNTTSADNFLNLIYGIQQSSAQPITFRVIASGSGIVGPPSASAFGINLILTDSGGLAGTILANVSLAFPADTWPETQFELTATPSAPAYYLYAYIFARYTNGTLTVRDAEVFQAGATASPAGYWRSAVVDAWQVADGGMSAGPLAPQQFGLYYGDLSNVDDMGSVEHSISVLSAFPLLITNEPGVNTSTDPATQARMQAVQSTLVANTAVAVYGYVNVGVPQSDLNGCIPTVASIEAAIDRCAAAGYAGVFFDGAGYDYGVPREEMVKLADYAHGKMPALSVYANAYFPADVLEATVNAATLTEPAAAPVLTAVAGSTGLAAGTYEMAYTYTTDAGETTLSPVAQVTISAGQAIQVASVPIPANGCTGVNYYLSTAAGSSTLGLDASGLGAQIDLTALPTGGIPPSSNTAYTANPSGTASPLGAGDWVLLESFYSRSDNEYAGVPEGGFQIVLDKYISGVSQAHALGVKVGALAYAFSATPLTSTTDQSNSWLLATMLGVDGWSYGGTSAANIVQWAPLASVPAVGNKLVGAVAMTSASPALPLMWQAETDQGIIWFAATDSPVSRSAGAFAVGNTPPALSVTAPSAQVVSGRVTPLVEGSADKSTWTTYNPASPTRYVRYTVTLQD